MIISLGFPILFRGFFFLSLLINLGNFLIIVLLGKGPGLIVLTLIPILAKSLAIGNPADGHYGLLTLEESNGVATSVPEDEIVNGIELLAEQEGIFTETAGGVVISALRSLAKRGIISTDEVVVAFVTGNGLKTVEVIEDAADPVFTDPDYKSFQDALDVWNKRN